ncbi:MAG TPA: hypothetical protein VMX17_03880 [Candidatus Glassbacteria bacterium]|nr:hypothetical protein [Candidatus Glassbacteria bacterium]
MSGNELTDAISNEKETERKRCGLCIFFDPHYDLCRVNPPVFLDKDGKTTWPGVDSEMDWCGSFRKRWEVSI